MTFHQRSFVTHLVLASLILVVPFTAGAQVQIAPSGSTSTTARMNNSEVRVTIRTVRLERSNSLFPSDEVWDAKEVTVAHSLAIKVGDQDLFVPRSAYSDWVDPRAAKIAFEKGEFVLRINGGDTANSYLVAIYFDAIKVKRRLVYSALLPQRVVQETQYRLSVLQDKP